MKALISIVLAAFAVASAGGALAQTAAKSGADAKATAKVEGAAHKATGVVKQADPAAGKVTLTHDPVKELNWPAMTMGFAVKDPALFKKLEPGKKIEFEFVQQGNMFIVTSVK